MAGQGWEITTFREKDLSALQPDPSRPFAWFSALAEPSYATQGRTYLPPATRMALSFLKQRSAKGFFMMIEGSQIDWACHANNGPNAVAEMLDFDRAIGEALRFARADGETLIIVTADHETGGMAIENGSTRDSLELTFTTNYHTAALVPVFAFGPGAERFNGVYENTDIYRKMKELLGL